MKNKLFNYNIQLFFYLYIFGSFFGYAQYFTGEIVYQNRIIPKNDSINLDSLIELQKNFKSVYLISQNQYKSSYYKYGKLSYSYTYDNETKRIYDYYPDREYIAYRDSRKGQNRFIPSKIYRDSLDKSFGMDVFLVIHNGSKRKRYYSDDLTVNFKAFEDHNVGNWFYKLKELNGSLLLKSITERENYFLINEVVEIKRRRVRKKEFKLPRLKIKVPNNSILDTKVSMKKMNSFQRDCYNTKLNEGEMLLINQKKHISYINFILTKEGGLEYVSPQNIDEYGFYKVALDIINNCKFEFEVGQLDNRKVDSFVKFNLIFQK